MVYCPSFLKKTKGATLIEVMIVALFISLLVVLLLVALKPATQMAKSRDARRKADLQKLKNPLEDYYNDHTCYPSSLDQLISDYLDRVPTDPLTHQPYTYAAEGCDKYRIYVKLEFEQDLVIVQVGCQNGCGPGGSTAYNYGISSTNTGLETGGEATPPATCSTYYACQAGYCNVVPTSSPLEPKFCDDPCCNNDCSGPSSCSP